MILSFYHTFRFWALISVLSLVLGAAATLAGLVDRSGNLAHRISSLWSRLLCEWNGIRVELTGLEHVQRDRAQVFVANHQGFYDIFALSGYLPVQIRWVAKAVLFKIPFVGWAMKAAGYVSVERGDRKKSYQSFMATVEKLKSGSSVVIFPEGTRSADGTIGPFKKGGHLLAQRSNAPMIPITIIGSKDIIRKGSGNIYPGPIRIIISAPVESDDSNKDEDVLESIRDTICKTYAKNLS